MRKGDLPVNERKYKWDRENTTMVTLKLTNTTDADIIAFLDGKAKQTIIKKALRYYMQMHPDE